VQPEFPQGYPHALGHPVIHPVCETPPGQSGLGFILVSNSRHIAVGPPGERHEGGRDEGAPTVAR
jgi:hypothetical protein